MNFIFLLPFAYFYKTRLTKATFAFHLVFEWMAAALLVAVFGKEPGSALWQASLCYLAFISVYEIGYFANDLFSARREAEGRLRGPQGVAPAWILAWVLTRLLVFTAVTLALRKQTSLEWWSFYAALVIVFSLHNVITDREFKAVTFSWLAWLRFLAPVIFIVDDAQRMGIALAAAVSYVAFRSLGYLDSKGLLCMPGRRRSGFRTFFFVMPLTAVLALWPYAEAKGFCVLISFFAGAALMGTTAKVVLGPKKVRVDDR